jgi:prepilin-type N-terminal cleavage/methylation domain-containing protein
MTKRSANARTRGFTLIEVVVATVIGVTLLGAVTGIMVTALRDSKRSRTIAGFQRDMAFVGQLFSMEIRQAGLGVPFDTNATNPPQGEHLDPAYGTAAVTNFYAPVIVAATSQVGIIADLPRDDSNYPTFGPLHSRPVLIPFGDAIAWHTENNGQCWQHNTGGLAPATCKIGDTSIFFPEPGATGCTSGTERTCPWALGRANNGEALLIADGAGRWATVRLGNTSSMVNRATNPLVALTPLYTVPMAPLSSGWPVPWPGLCSANNPGPGTNCPLGETPSAAPGTPVLALVGNPGEIPGGGFVSTPDRVFYRLSNGTAANTATCAVGAPNFCNIERIRCWGDPDPQSASFPNPAGTSVPATPSYNALSAASNCGPAEVVARNVSSLTFTYTGITENTLAGPFNSIATKSAIRRVNYRVIFRKTVNGRIVSFTGSGSVRLQNL